MAKKQTLSKNKKIAYYLMIPLIALTLALIFWFSTMNKEASAEMSNGFAKIFGDFIDKIISIFTDESVNIRKVAHFAEYAVLGAEVAIFADLVSRFKPQTVCNIAFFGLASAVADESIQIISSRGASVSDVLLDCRGYATGVIIVLIIIFIKAGISAVKNR